MALPGVIVHAKLVPSTGGDGRPSNVQAGLDEARDIAAGAAASKVDKAGDSMDGELLLPDGTHSLSAVNLRQLLAAEAAAVASALGQVVTAFGDWFNDSSGETLLTAFRDLVAAVQALTVRTGALELGQTTGIIAYATLADLQADLVPPDKSLAYVTSDSLLSNRGYYRKSGATGTGSWTQTAYDQVETVRAALQAQLSLLESDVAELENVAGLDVGFFQTRQFAGRTLDILPFVADDDGRSLLSLTRSGGLVAELDDATLAASGIDSHPGTGFRYSFAITDADDRALLAFGDDGRLVDSDAFIADVTAGSGITQHSGVALVYSFAILDEDGRALLAFDAAGDMIWPVISGGGSSGSTATALPQADVRKHALALTRADYNILLMAGQSNANGAHASALTTTQPYPTGAVVVGTLRTPDLTATAFSPLVEYAATIGGGDYGETPTAGAVDQAILLHAQALPPWAADRQDWVGINNSVGGAPIANIAKGTAAYNLGIAGATRAAFIAGSLGASVRCRAVCWMQGETDLGAGMTQAAYHDALQQLASDYNTDLKAVTGQADPVLFLTYQQASHGFYNLPPAIALAQLQLHEEGRTFLAFPMYPFSYNDPLHLLTHEFRRAGEYFGKALHRLMDERRPWEPVRPVKWVRTDANTIDLTFVVPVPPLALDIALVAAATNYGFQVLDGSGNPISISSVTLTGPTTVRIRTGDAVSAGHRVTYATAIYAPNGGSGTPSGPRGNLRDSDPALSQFTDAGGAYYNLYNWCVMFDKTLA
jgi:hypothetical protein